jgi:hypothetical protein
MSQTVEDVHHNICGTHLCPWNFIILYSLGVRKFWFGKSAVENRTTSFCICGSLIIYQNGVLYLVISGFMYLLHFLWEKP